MLRLRSAIAWSALVLAEASAMVASAGSSAQPANTERPAPASVPGTARADVHFDIMEFRVLGNTLLPRRVIERAVYPFLGPNRDLAVIQQAVAALEKAYKDAGYGTVYVDIPPQNVDEGIVRLQVTEGKLAQVQIEGEHYTAGRQILAQLPALKIGQTPNLPAVEQQLSSLNGQTAERSVTPILKAGPTPGTVAIDLKVQDSLPFHAAVEVNDQYTAYTIPERVAVSASYDNLWQLNHSLSLQYQTAPGRPQDAQIGAATYLIRQQSTPSMWAFSYIRSNSEVATLGTLGVLGKGSIYGIRWIDPIFNTPTRSSSVTVGVDYKDFAEDVKLSGAPGLDTPIRYLNWSALYSDTLRLSRRSIGYTAGVSFGVRDLINNDAQFEARRYDATPNYLKLTGSAQLLQALPASMAVLLRVTGQWAAGPLIDDEQFSLGGVETVRGYLEAEALGDNAGAATLEVHTPPVGSSWGRVLQSMYGFGFGDAGLVSLDKALPKQVASTHLASAGVGVHVEDGPRLVATLDLADPLITGPYTHRGRLFVNFSVRAGL